MLQQVRQYFTVFSCKRIRRMFGAKHGTPSIDPPCVLQQAAFSQRTNRNKSAPFMLLVSFVVVLSRRAQGLRTLRVQERKERAREEKLAAKAAHKAASSSGGVASASAAGGDGAPPRGGGEKKSRLKNMFSRGSKAFSSDLGSSEHSTANSLGGGAGAGGGGGGMVPSRSNSNFPGSSVLPQPSGIGGGMDMSKTGWMDASRRSFLDSSRTGGGGFLDTSIRGLDASVRGGQNSQPIAA